MMSEQIYDEQIAPLLLEVGKICQTHGLPLVAQVEYEPGEMGLTKFLPAGSGMAMEMMNKAARCRNNVDSLIMWLMAHAKEHGHSSIFLMQLGVPVKPGQVPA